MGKDKEYYSRFEKVLRIYEKDEGYLCEQVYGAFPNEFGKNIRKLFEVKNILLRYKLLQRLFETNKRNMQNQLK